MSTTTTKKLRATIRGIHEDGSTCKHKHTSSGKLVAGQDCPGRVGFRADCSCSCGEFELKALKVLVEHWKKYIWHGRH